MIQGLQKATMALKASDELYERARALAARQDRSVSSLIRTALEEYLAVEEKRQERIEAGRKARLETAIEGGY